MGGGLLQLVAVGIQDIYIIGNPQITFFKTIYKRYTNFSLESIQQSIDGRTDFGQYIQVTIDRKGDLVKDILFDILLPILPSGYYWTNGIGNVLLKQIDLEIGGQLIDRHYSEWLDIWSQLTINASKIGAYDSMVGNYNTLSSLEANAQQQLRVQIPMFFWFNREYSMALPLIALQYHEVVLKVKLRDLNSCIRNNTIDTPLQGYVIQQFRVWADYIYLDMDERKQFAQKSHEYLIDQLQFAGDTSITADQSKEVKVLNFNHPVKEIYWTNTKNTYLQTNILTGNQQLDYSLSLTLQGETFNEATILLNGIERFQSRPAQYFRLVQNYQFHTRYSAKNIYIYSFSLYPEKHQPSGSCNMSKITTTTLYIDYTNVTNINGVALVLKVYGVNYNIFRIMSGMGGLSFSS
jgi:hypothetical protein